MDFELNDEQRMFRDTLRSFVEKEIIPVASEWEREDRYPTEIVETMKAMGLFGITIPEEYGGLGVDMVSFALVFEEIARGWMGVAGILGSALAGLLDHRQARHRGAEGAVPARAGHRRSGAPASP